jgi:hypothetical protein
MIPDTHPHRLRTYGRESTPDPIAEALNAKMLPLSDPASSLEKVLAQKDLSSFEPCAPGAYLLRSAIGERAILDGNTLISSPTSAYFGLLLFFMGINFSEALSEPISS